MARTCLLLLPLAPVFLLCGAFNIDTDNPTRFQGDTKGYFGFKVIQLKANNASWVVVSAPLAGGDTLQKSGAIYRCSYIEEACKPIPVNNTLPISLGLTVATDDRSLTGLTACGPTYTRQCEENSYLSGICYLFDKDFHMTEERRPSYQECITGVDAVILYDDSHSITSDDFRRMKNFMANLIRFFKEFNIRFAVVQYSTEINIVFDFKYYQEVGDLKVLEGFPHTKGNTYTPSAIKYVADNLFTEEKGARRNTKRLLITITDGASNDKATNFMQATAAADHKQIIRYAIGVGDAFKSPQALEELHTIASSKENAFPVNNFSALASIQSALANRIFIIEGTQQVSNSSSFQLELSQGGFSALMTEDILTVGTVGAYDWSGGLEELRGNLSTFINVTLLDSDMKDSYLGYAVTLIRSNREILYVTGAPRYKHVGRVDVFQKDHTSGAWRTRQHLVGDQIGSYFGAELTSVDLDGNGETDLVLIGVPLYHAQGVGGIVQVCSVTTGNITCNETLSGSAASTHGRFGAAMDCLGDVSWDGLADVAVGAPLEDEHRGAIYIFHGQKEGTLGPLPSQRIAGSVFSAGLKYFGVSIHGRLDMSEDRLTDIAVGSLGQALILRSRPVIAVSAYLTFDPPQIPLDRVECSRRTHNPSLMVGRTTICFNITRVSHDRLGELSLLINYSLKVDTGRRETEQKRLVIGEQDTGSLSVSAREACFQRDIRAPVCVEDFLSPVKIMMNFSATGDPIVKARGLRPILDPASNTMLQTEVLFEKNCGDDEVCIADLKVSVNNSGTVALVAVSGFLVNLTVLLENVGEIAYSPRLKLFYPMGLSFRRAATIQSLHRSNLICDMTGISNNQSEKSIICTVSPSVLRENTQVMFVISFQVLEEDQWGEWARFSIQAYSENENGTLDDNIAIKDIPVLQATNIIVKGLESITYLNFSTRDPEKRLLFHSYQVQNLGRQDVPVNFTVQLPLVFDFGFQWEISRHFTVKGQNTACTNLGSDVPFKSGPVRDGAQARSQVLRTRMIQCHIASLSRAGVVSFHFEGPFFPSKVAQLSVQKQWVQSEASITIDSTRFYQSLEERFHYAQVTTEVEVISVVNLLPIVLGSSIAGLVLLALLVAILYRVGFFKRTSKVGANEGAGQVELDNVPPSSEETGALGTANGQAQNMTTEPSLPETTEGHENSGQPATTEALDTSGHEEDDNLVANGKQMQELTSEPLTHQEADIHPLSSGQDSDVISGPSAHT
ncbi:integrin alpha-M-like isoform X2 [Pleurodeles waltl]|uniref:integrin alpha-M-like isoform X2 n=1 Tax=Pleurodeles waltl TaxID=8319 RepID=UPI003709B962